MNDIEPGLIDAAQRTADAAEAWPRQAADLQADAAKAADARTQQLLLQARELHETAERAAAARHDAMLQAYAAAQAVPDDLLALHLLAGLPPELDDDTERRVIERRIGLVKAYRAGTVQPAPLPSPAPPALPDIRPVQEISELRHRSGWCGWMARNGSPDPEYWQRMAATGATLARCWYTAAWNGEMYVIPPEQFAVMRQAVANARAVRISLIVVISVPADEMPFGVPERLAAFPSLVVTVHQVHADQPDVVIDLLNEPTRPYTRSPWPQDQQDIVNSQWRELAYECIDRLPAWRRVVYQLGFAGQPRNFKFLPPLLAPNVIHGAMGWVPHEYTHQGVPEMQAGQPLSPAIPFDDRMRAEQREALDALAYFADTYELPVIIVETGAMAHLPDAAQCVEGVIRFARERNWPFLAHEFEGWPGWRWTEPMLKMLSGYFAGMEAARPKDLDAKDAPWYLAQIAAELQDYGWPVDIDAARRLWREWGRQQGRKWSPTSPGWGPSAKDRP